MARAPRCGRAGFDDAFLHEGSAAIKLPARCPPRIACDEAWASFAAWIASTDKIEF